MGRPESKKGVITVHLMFLQLGAVHKLRKAERGGGGVKKSLRFLTRGRGGTWSMPYVRLNIHIFRLPFCKFFDNFLSIKAKIGKL